MKKLIGLLVVLVFVSPAQARTLKFERGTIDVNQLHEELLTQFPQWRGTPQPDGSWRDPSLYVESTDSEILLTIPEDAPEALVNQVVATHHPRPLEAEEPATEKTAREKLRVLGFTDAETTQIVN